MRTRANKPAGGGERLFSVDPLAFLPLAAFIWFVRDLTLPAALTAAVLHECGHLAALFLAGGRPTRMILHPFGGEIEYGGRLFSYPQSMFLSLAGPAVNLLCAPACLLSPPFLRVFGLCSLGLGLFNLLPVRGLDGGEILEDLVCLWAGVDRARVLSLVISAFTVCFLLAAGLYGAIRRLFCPSYLLPILYLFLAALVRARAEKRPQTAPSG